MAEQGDVKGRLAGGVGGNWLRCGGSHLPAGGGGAGGGLAGAEQQGEDARARRRQPQAAAGGEIELRRLAPGLDNDRCDRGAADGFDTCAQQGEAIGGLDKQQPGGIEPKFGEAQRVDAAGGAGALLAQPDDGAGAPAAIGEEEGETRCGSLVAFSGGKDFVQGGPGETAGEARVENGRPQSDARGGISRAFGGQGHKGLQGERATHLFYLCSISQWVWEGVKGM